MLNPQAPLPLYQQLAEMLRDKIREGRYPPGSRIPSENQLAAAHGIGRPTVRQALEVLVRNGMLVRRRGAGTFVRSPERELDLFSLAGTTAAFARKGVAVTTRMLQRIRVQRVTGHEGNPFEGDRAFFFSRLNRVTEAPVLIEDIYLDPALFTGIERIDLSAKSLSRVVAEHYYMQPVGGRQTFRISYLSGAKAAALEVGPRTPVLRVQRTLNFPQAQNAIFAELYCRTDRFVFAQEIGEMHHV